MLTELGHEECEEILKVWLQVPLLQDLECSGTRADPQLSPEKESS